MEVHFVVLPRAMRFSYDSLFQSNFMAYTLTDKDSLSHESEAAWVWLLPFAAVLAYPQLLALFYSQVHESGGSRTLAVVSIVLAFGVSALGFATALRVGRSGQPGSRGLTARRFAYLTIAAPPMFTFLGVILYLMKIDGADAAVWSGLWIAAAVLAAMRQLSRAPESGAVRSNASNSGGAPSRGLAALRVMHGVSAVALILVFLGPHLFNHVFGWFGEETHLALMHTLRKLYRNSFVEPTMLLVMAFQLLSGIALWLPKTRRPSDLLGVLQLASGIYLSFFIASHVNSVFVLARHFGTDTNWAWAVAAPAGLTGDAWSVRLIPHYTIAVFMLLGHLACGMRTVLLGHGVQKARADRWTWGAIGFGTIVTAVISGAMLGGRL
jgi:hypothetical protein